MWGPLHYRTWLVYSNDEPPQKSSRSSWASELDAPPLVSLESFHILSSFVHPLHGNPYSSHHIYHLAFSRLWLSSLMWAFHTFLSSSSIIFLFAILSVNFLAYAHPLHECSKYRKGVDQFDLYLASGLGTSQDKISKKTKCETLVDWVLNIKTMFFSRIPISPFLHANTIWRHSSHGQRELLHLYVLTLLVSILNIDSCLLLSWLELHILLALF